jgi:hypothetical protein
MGQKISRDLLLLLIEFVVILLSVLTLESFILLLLLLLSLLVNWGLRLRLSFALLSLFIFLLDELILSLLGLLLSLIPDPLEVAVDLLVFLRGLLRLSPYYLHWGLLLLVEGIEIRLTRQDLNCLEVSIITGDVQSCVLSVLVPLLWISMMVKKFRHYAVVLLLCCL